MFEDRTQEKIKAEMLSEINPATGLSSMAGSFADAVIGAAARQISEIYQALPAVVSMLFVDETSGSYLDLVGQTYFNITRRSGTRAVCGVTLYGTPGTVVPKGTVFLTAGGLRFILRSDTRLDGSGQAIETLDAADVGEAYNIGENALTGIWVNIPGLKAYTNWPAINGTDDESDSQFYARIDAARKRPATSGNGWDYRRWALEVDGVGTAKVVELAHGPGTVEIMVVDSTYHAASPEIVSAVEARIAASRPVGASPFVRAPGSVVLTVNAAVTINSAVTTLTEVKDQLQAGLEEYLHGLVDAKYGKIYYGPDEDEPYRLVYNRVLAILLTIQGVEDFSALTVNSGTEDLILQADQVPIVGKVIVT